MYFYKKAKPNSPLTHPLHIQFLDIFQSKCKLHFSPSFSIVSFAEAILNKNFYFHSKIVIPQRDKKLIVNKILLQLSQISQSDRDLVENGLEHHIYLFSPNRFVFSFVNCYLCNSAIESIEHIFLQYDQAAQIWQMSAWAINLNR